MVQNKWLRFVDFSQLTGFYPTGRIFKAILAFE